MNAMIFAAGLGTRLRPLTNTIPKALVDFRGKPLLWYAIQNAIDLGAERIVVNVHHFAEKIIGYIETNQWPVEILISDESGQLLDTGGGLVFAKSRFIPNKPIYVQNADIVITTDLKKFLHSHELYGNDITLMVKERKTTRYLHFDREDALVGWENTGTGERIKVKQAEVALRMGFCGIHLLQPHILDYLGEVRPFSIINAYLDLAARLKVKGFKIADEDKWFDVGTVEKLKEAQENY